MKTFFPATGSEADWNAAYYRLEDYFRSLRLVNKVHQSQIILRILQESAARHAMDTSQNPTALAMEQTRIELNQWFETILGRRERIAVVGLISMLAIDAPDRWPVAILSDDSPIEFRHEMKESDVRAGPDLRVSSMVPRPIDVSPLLDPDYFSDAMMKVRQALAIFAMVVVLAAVSFTLFLFAR